MYRFWIREYVFEFSDHYNENHKPVQEFGKKFFDAWNKEEWNTSDNFMIGCLQYYLENGLVEYERISLNKKMLVESTSDDFVEYIEELECNVCYDKKITYNKFIEIYSDYKNKNFQQKIF